MSTFTKFIAPQGGNFSSRDLLNLIEAYNQLSIKLNQHIEAIAPTDPVVHGIKAALDALKAELENAISLRATKNEVNDIRNDMDLLATKQALQNAQQSLNELIATKADADIIPTLTKKVDFNQLSEYVERINTALGALINRYNSFCLKYDETVADKALFKSVVETTKQFVGTLYARDLIEFNEWKLFSAQFAGTGATFDATTNGLYILGEMSQLWTKNEPDVEKVKSAVAFIKYVNDRPFDAIVHMTATSFTEGALEVLISQGATRFTNLCFHLIVNTDHDGVDRVYLAVSADELKSQSTEFRACGINFLAGGTVNGVVKSIETVRVKAKFNVSAFSADSIKAEHVYSDHVHGSDGKEIFIIEGDRITIAPAYAEVVYNVVPAVLHDDILDPLVMKSELTQAVESLTTLIDTEKQERVAEDTRIEEKFDTALAEEKEARETKDTELETLIRASMNVQCGEMMYWPVSECVEREFHSDHPFKFKWRGQEYEVEPEDPVIHRLDISTNVPMGWHACDGTCVPAADYPKLAEFIPDNVDKDGNIWIPYIRKTIIKVVE